MIKSIEDLDLEGRVTFIRVDFNVPIADGRVGDDSRIRAALPTLKLARERGARLVLASHLGRPKGERKPEFSLEPVAAALARHLDCEVTFADDCVGDGVKKHIKDSRPGDVILLENTRFHAGETKNDEELSRAMAEGVEVYVNDAFGTAHRAHASTVGMVRFVREKGAGLLLKKELEHLGQLLGAPKKPFVAIVGGAKVSDKIAVLQSLADKCDTIMIGGAMAYTLLKAQGVPVGTSRVEEDKLDMAEQFLKSAKARKVQVLLPDDHVVAAAFEESATAEVVTEIADDRMGLDIGPKTRARYREAILGAKTLFWNGPMGVFEWESFAKGTFDVADAVAESEALSVVGGGDSVSALNKSGNADRVTHVSTGGGASLEFVEGKRLPGVVALEEAS
jgi:phosphoglycerate kinase